jgi:hypothetical protein
MVLSPQRLELGPPVGLNLLKLGPELFKARAIRPYSLFRCSRQPQPMAVGSAPCLPALQLSLLLALTHLRTECSAERVNANDVLDVPRRGRRGRDDTEERRGN